MLTTSATDVRKDWGGFIDSVVREKPRMIKRSRDYILAISIDMLRDILKSEKMHILLFNEEDGSVTAVIDELDLTANAPNEEQVIQQLADDAIEYANEYYDQFSYWHSAPNRRQHLAFVLAILACDPEKVSKELFICQVGKI